MYHDAPWNERWENAVHPSWYKILGSQLNFRFFENTLGGILDYFLQESEFKRFQTTPLVGCVVFQLGTPRKNK